MISAHLAVVLDPEVVFESDRVRLIKPRPIDHLLMRNLALLAAEVKCICSLTLFVNLGNYLR